MLWNFEVTDGVSDPLKAMDRAFAQIENDIAAVDKALDTLEKRQKSKAALADMPPAFGRKGAAALQAPDVAAFTKKKEASEQVNLLHGATPEQRAAFQKTMRDFNAQMDRWEDEKRATQHRTAGLRQLDAITNTYGKDVGKLNKHLAEMERHERLEQALAIKDPKQRQLALMRYQREEMSKSVNETRKLKSSLDTIKWLEIGRAAYGAAEKVYGLAKSFMHLAIAEGGERRAGIRTLEVMLGDQKAAEDQWELIEKMSDRTKISAGDIMNTYRMLFSFTQKYGVRATQDVIAASEDINMILGESAKGAFLSVIRNLEAMGKFDERAVRMLKQVGVATPEKVYKALAQQRGVTEDQAKKLMSTGKVDATEGINTLLALVQKNLSKGALGSVSAKSALGSVPTQLKNIERMWGNLFDTLNTKPLATLLAKVAEAMDPATERGAKMQKVIQKAFDVITRAIQFAYDHMDTFMWALDVLTGDLLMFFGNLEAGLTLLDRLASSLGVIGTRLIQFDAAVLSRDPAAIWDAMKGMAEIPTEMARMKDAFGDAARQIGANTAEEYRTIFGQQKDEMAEHGRHAAEGFAQGMESQQQRVIDAATNMAKGAEQAVRIGMQIQSPSRVMERLGLYTGQGFQVGIDSFGPTDMSGLMDIRIPSPKFGLGADTMMATPRFATAAELSATMAAAPQQAAQPPASAPVPSKSITIEVPVTINAGSVPAAQQWAELRPLIQSEFRAEFVRISESLAEED